MVIRSGINLNHEKYLQYSSPHPYAVEYFAPFCHRLMISPGNYFPNCHMKLRNSLRAPALLQSIVLQVQHVQAQEYQFYVVKAFRNQLQRKGPEKVGGCFNIHVAKHNSNKKVIKHTT